MFCVYLERLMFDIIKYKLNDWHTINICLKDKLYYDHFKLLHFMTKMQSIILYHMKIYPASFNSVRHIFKS